MLLNVTTFLDSLVRNKDVDANVYIVAKKPLLESK